MGSDRTDDRDLESLLADPADPRWRTYFRFSFRSSDDVAAAEFDEWYRLNYDLGIVQPFDWTAWLEQRPDVMRPDFDLQLLSLDDAMRWITAVIRADRFNEGLLDDELRSGRLGTVARRLWQRVQRACGDRAGNVDDSSYSDDMVHRWWYERRWDVGPRLCFVGLNPSTGDTDRGQRPTMRKLVTWAKREGCGAVVVVNLFTLRSTDPGALLTSTCDPVGAQADEAIRRNSAGALVTLVGWGAHSMAAARAEEVLPLLDKPVCAGTTKAGAPRHPLLVPNSTEFVPYAPAATGAGRVFSSVQPRALPEGLIALAFDDYGRVQRLRVERLYNRPRAVFAEFIVAQLLPGAAVSEDPASAWDVTWPVADRRIRIEVKCSGEFLPRKGAKHRSRARWEFPVPKSGFDPDLERVIQTGTHNFDVLLLARHVGSSIDAGWMFFVLTAQQASALNGRATIEQLRGQAPVEPEALAAAVHELINRM